MTILHAPSLHSIRNRRVVMHPLTPRRREPHPFGVGLVEPETSTKVEVPAPGGAISSRSTEWSAIDWKRADAFGLKPPPGMRRPAPPRPAMKPATTPKPATVPASKPVATAETETDAEALGAVWNAGFVAASEGRDFAPDPTHDDEARHAYRTGYAAGLVVRPGVLAAAKHRAKLADAAWDLGYRLGREGVDAAPSRDLSAIEREAFLDGLAAGDLRRDVELSAEASRYDSMIESVSHPIEC